MKASNELFAIFARFSSDTPCAAIDVISGPLYILSTAAFIISPIDLIAETCSLCGFVARLFVPTMSSLTPMCVAIETASFIAVANRLDFAALCGFVPGI